MVTGGDAGPQHFTLSFEEGAGYARDWSKAPPEADRHELFVRYKIGLMDLPRLWTTYVAHRRLDNPLTGDCPQNRTSPSSSKSFGLWKMNSLGLRDRYTLIGRGARPDGSEGFQGERLDVSKRALFCRVSSGQLAGEKGSTVRAFGVQFVVASHQVVEGDCQGLRFFNAKLVNLVEGLPIKV
jgi:hypothetical protein